MDEELITRIENLERMVIAIPALLQDHVPPYVGDSLYLLTSEFFDVTVAINPHLKEARFQRPKPK